MSARSEGEGFPPLVPLGLSLLSAFLLISSIFTSTRIVLFGQDVDGRIVALKSSRGLTWVEVEYQTPGGGAIRSSRAGLNGEELLNLAQRVGRFEPGGPFDQQAMIGASVPIRFAKGRPELAHIRGWAPLYRDLVTGHAAWLLCAALARLTYLHRRRAPA